MNRRVLQNVSWLTGATVCSRVAALAQTVLVARALGATGYGVFGFIMNTLGLLSAFAGLQLGLTATVFVSRYKETEPAKARLIIRQVSRLGTVTGVGIVLVLAPLSPWLKDWLLRDEGTTTAVFLSTFILPLSVASGIQEGILKGFEDFRHIALVNVGQSVLSLALTYPAAARFGVSGAIGAICLALAIKTLILGARAISRLPKQIEPVVSDPHTSIGRLLTGFALPTIIGTMVASGATWMGSYLLSRQPNGFEHVAIFNVGIQWRSPLILLATIAGSVVIPRLSDHHGKGEREEMARIKGGLVKWTALAATLGAVVICLAAPLILTAYGKDFAGGEAVMSILAVSAVPEVVAAAYLQKLVAVGRAWRQMLLTSARTAPTIILIWYWIDLWGALGYGAAVLVSWVAFAIFITLLERGETEKVLSPGHTV